jgi:hypothetical protein
MRKINWSDSLQFIIASGLLNGLFISALDNFLLDCEIKPMVMVFLFILSSSLWGIINFKRAWISALSVWIPIHVIRLVKNIFYSSAEINPENKNSYYLFAAISLLLCLLAAYASVIARRISLRAKL